MKTILVLTFCLLAFSKQHCSHKKLSSTGYYKGRLEVKGACANFTIKLLEGNLDTSLITKEWKDERTGKTHYNVFALKSHCTFPSSINEGDDFYFTIDSNYVQRCMTCLIYYPTPQKYLAIKVVNGQ